MLFLLFLLFTLLHQSPISHCLQYSQHHGQCNYEKCGKLHVPFPFHLNSSCASVSNAFRLFCSNSAALYLSVDSRPYSVLDFFSDGILVDFPGSSSCRQYNDLNSFGFTGNDYFGISVDNVIGVYDCEDSSLCKADCETIDFPGCDGKDSDSPACCYPLSDHSLWNFGDGFSVFSRFGCRGFSSWAVSRGTNTGKRGVKLEWAVPRNSSEGLCADNATIVNATSVDRGMRCKCQDGFVGDGYGRGAGCLKPSIEGGQKARDNTRDIAKRDRGRMVTILAGVVGPVLIIASLIALFCLLKRPVKAGLYETDHAPLGSTISFRKTCGTRLFSYIELEDATGGFEDGQKLASSKNNTIYAGVLGDGIHIAVQKVQCQGERDISQVLSRIEILSAVSHRSMARFLGCCVDRVHSPHVVYEYPGNGTLEEHLHRIGEHKSGFDWYKRLNIAAETAILLAFLQYEIIPPIFHHDLNSSNIFLDEDSSVKVAGFRLLTTSLGNESHPFSNHEGSGIHRSDVYSFGVLLLELITGTKNKELPAVALQKIKSGKLEEIVDPSLYYHEQPLLRREQIERVADLATRCLLFGGDGKIGMIEVAKEVIHIAKENIDGTSKRSGPRIEETFSNSSLLQMISMSPDSVYLP